MKEFYTAKEAAAYIGVSHGTLMSWVSPRQGRVQRLKIDHKVGNVNLFRADAVEALKQEREKAGGQFAAGPKRKKRKYTPRKKKADSNHSE